MNVFNRIVVVLLFLGLIALAVFAVARPLQLLDWAQTNLALFGEQVFDAAFWQMFSIGAYVLIALLVILLWLEVRRRRRKTVRVKTRAKSDAQLALDSVAHSLEYRIDELAGVRKVVPKIRSYGKSAAIQLDLDTSPSVNIGLLTDQIVDMVHDIVEGQLGLKIAGKVHVNVHHEPYPKGTMPPTQPLGPEGEMRPTVVESKPEARRRPEPARRPAVQAPAPAPEPEPVAYKDSRADEELALEPEEDDLDLLGDLDADLPEGNSTT
ncbi:MAG: alkaline shock response membrane anchor protein AmaP [Anaerolineae bacterium]|jgi:hypothetical protein